MFQVSDAEFDDALGDALDALPERFAGALDNVVLFVEDKDPAHPRRRGVYVGVPQTKRGHAYMGHLPDRITLYREPIKATSTDRESLEATIRQVLLHEIAHHFGISDSHLRTMGY